MIKSKEVDLLILIIKLFKFNWIKVIVILSEMESSGTIPRVLTTSVFWCYYVRANIISLNVNKYTTKRITSDHAELLWTSWEREV